MSGTLLFDGECEICGAQGWHECQDESADLDVRIDQFLNRWHWRGDRAVVRAELVELLTRPVDGTTRTA